MDKVLYYLLLKPLSYLPFSLLYLFSDFLYFLLYKVLGYRQKVVRTNLQNSFPEKTPGEIKNLESAFYSHFFDLIVESVKLFSISKEELNRRSRILNPEVLDRFYDEGKSIIIVGSHYNNWELGAAILSNQVKHEIIGIYSQVVNIILCTFIMTSIIKKGPVVEVNLFWLL